MHFTATVNLHTSFIPKAMPTVIISEIRMTAGKIDFREFKLETKKTVELYRIFNAFC